MGIYQIVQQFVSIKKKTIFFSLNINNFNEEKKKYILVHVLAINTHVFLLKYMFIKFKIETLMNEWKIYIIYFESI